MSLIISIKLIIVIVLKSCYEIKHFYLVNRS
ncbi:Uncharacterised protein [Vibrio cholerae]|nr:Uncharacterised protein [Vibrio cholerae]